MGNLIPRSILGLDPTDILFRDLFDSEEFFRPIMDVKRINYPIDIKVTKNGLELDVAAVGLEKEDFNVEVKNGTLYVSYNKKAEDSNEGEEYIYRGITRKAFSFSFKLDGFDSTKIDATLDKGILKIVVPHFPDKIPTKITVK